MNSPFKANTDPSSGSSAPERQQSKGQGALDLEAGDTATEQAAPVKAADKAIMIRQDRVAELALKREEADAKFLDQLNSLTTLDWEDMPVPVLATLLMSKPIKGKKDEPDRHMNGKQALIYAACTKSLNAGCKDPQKRLDPFLNDMWPDLDTMKVNVTVEGQRKIASRRGDLGIATWKFVERPLGNGVEKRFPWQKADIGCEYTIPVGNKEVTCTAWLSPWFKNYSPMWRDNWEHMLKVRAEGLCYEVITGVGISQPHEDRDVENAVKLEIPSFTKEKKDEPPTVG